MAYVRDDDEARQRSSGGGGYVGGGYVGGSLSAPAAPPSGSSGGNFTNIGQYIAGMEGQGAEVAQDLSSKVSAQGEQAIRDIGGFQTGANRMIQEGTPTTPTADELGGVTSDVAPQTFSYGGPSEFSMAPGYGQAQSSVAKTGEMTKGLGSFAGVQSMLKQGKQPGYSGSYDAMLARAGGGQKMADTAKKYSGLGDTLKGAERDVSFNIGGAQAQANNVNNAWQETFNMLKNKPKDTGWGVLSESRVSGQKNLVVPQTPAAPVLPQAPKYNGKPEKTEDQLSQLFTQDPLLTGYSYQPSKGFTNKGTAPLTPMAGHNNSMDFVGTFNPLEGIAPTPNIKPLTDKLKVPKKTEQFTNWRW